MWWPVLLALGLSLTLSACGTTYQPRPSQRVSLLIRHGGPVYSQAGHEHPIGPFSGKLEALVADQPQAAARARRARHQLQVGIPAYLGGLGGVVVGLLVAGPVGWIVLGVGAATAGTGLGFMGAGVTNAVDAINIHNDGVPVERGEPGEPPCTPPR